MVAWVGNGRSFPLAPRPRARAIRDVFKQTVVRHDLSIRVPMSSSPLRLWLPFLVYLKLSEVGPRLLASSFAVAKWKFLVRLPNLPCRTFVRVAEVARD